SAGLALGAAAGFLSSYDLNNDGTWDVTDTVASAAATSFPNPGSDPVRGRIKDQEDAFTLDTTTVVVSNPAGGHTYHLATTGSDTNSGSSSAPWATLQKAANTVQAGDTVIVHAGTYVGMNRYGKTGGTAAAPISFLADPGVIVTHVPSSGLPNDTLADINVEASGGYYVIQGFTINSDGTAQRAGIRLAGSDNTRVLSNAVDRAFIGIFVSDSQGVLVQGNT